ncbi:hypothetical protein FACS189443_3030 [Planctomycetales bacterium]|nr:hypothetical protein FACS189443_3030 [Planctomycetales bacterium]
MIQLWLEMMFGVAMIISVRLALGRWLGPRVCRLLWLLVVVRALIPVTLPTQYHPLGWLNWESQIVRREITQPDTSMIVLIPDSVTPDVITPSAMPNVASSVVTQNIASTEITDNQYGLSALNGLWIVWFVGFAFVFLGAAIRNRQIIAGSTRLPSPVPDWVQEIFLETREKLRVGAFPVLIAAPCVPAPCLVGAVRPRILLPESVLENEDRKTVRFILLHELTHLKQGDIWFSWLWTLTVAVHWFNPLFWLTSRLVKLDCETACDDRVLATLNDTAKKNYAESLLELIRNLNPLAGNPAAYSSGSCAVIETSSNLERRITMMTFHKMPTLRRSLFGAAVLMFVAALSLTGYSEPKTISPEKAKMIGYVEDFLMNNFRDVTMRKSLEWGDVKTDDKGNSTIRYRCEALIWDKDRMILTVDFTFDKNGKFVSQSKVESTPVKVEKPDITTAAGVKRLVEKFFSENFLDITARKTIKWGDVEKNEDGGVSITYRYEATIWDKDKIINEQKFTFDKDGKFVGHETLNKEPVKKGNTKPENNSAKKEAKREIADQYFEYLVEKDFSKANEMGNEQFKKSERQVKNAWENLVNKHGNFEKIESTVSQNIKEGTKSFTVFDKECLFEKGKATLRITVDENDKIAGFFVVSLEPQGKEIKTENTKPDSDNAKKGIEKNK